LRRLLTGWSKLYRNVLEQFPGVSDDLSMTCRIREPTKSRPPLRSDRVEPSQPLEDTPSRNQLPTARIDASGADAEEVGQLPPNRPWSPAVRTVGQGSGFGTAAQLNRNACLCATDGSYLGFCGGCRGAAAAVAALGQSARDGTVGQDLVDLPSLVVRGALDPELVLFGVAACGAALIEGGEAILGQAVLEGIDNVDIVDPAPRWFSEPPWPGFSIRTSFGGGAATAKFA